MKAHSLSTLKLWLFFSVNVVANAERVNLSVTNTIGGVILDVTIYLDHPCGRQRTVEWQAVPTVQGTKIFTSVRITEHGRRGGICPQVLVPYSQRYHLPLAVGQYQLIVYEFTTQILDNGIVLIQDSSHSLPFTVNPLPPELRIRVSEVEMCWMSSRGQWYRLEYRSSITTNNWLPVTSWLPGTGQELCVKDLVPKSADPQRYYRVISTNSLTQ